MKTATAHPAVCTELNIHGRTDGLTDEALVSSCLVAAIWYGPACRWLEEARLYSSPNMVITLVGNKADAEGR